MTLQEFTKLTGLNPTEAYYHNVIEKEGVQPLRKQGKQILRHSQGR